MARIGIFGGSFDPPHRGHILAAKEFQRVLELDELLLVPAAVPPHKSLAEGSPDGQTRAELLRLAAKDLPFAQVDDIELRRDGVSYTVDTVRALREEYPEDELFLCVGTDMFESFSSWRQPEQIASMATIAMAHRVDADRKRLDELAQAFERDFGKAPVFIENEHVEISSTHVRRLLILGGAEQYVSPQVLAKIREDGLYGVGKCRKGLPFEELKEESLRLLKKKRVAHVIGCSETAKRLALIHGADPVDAERAGILHDVTKALTGQDQLHLCEKYDIMISRFEREHTKLLHAVTGAAVAKEVFGENDAVCQAIRWHTSGRADMTTLEKIVYIADYMEPNRDLPGVDRLRYLAQTDLDAAVLLGLEMTADHLRKQGAEMGRHSIEAIEHLKKGMK
ncbi:MAG: nicotinate (nicotinamide) nucleotide adenylyltransferase [Oscillospiraceae bacterium]|nr:nicotinate (nicotinamide) nucleotide adenylyltransferase [Oscillospiraceae bacterium]